MKAARTGKVLRILPGGCTWAETLGDGSDYGTLSGLVNVLGLPHLRFVRQIDERIGVNLVDEQLRRVCYCSYCFAGEIVENALNYIELFYEIRSSIT